MTFPQGSRIFAYLRDSGHENQELSIEQQIHEITAWASQHGYVIERFYKDEAKRGSTDKQRDQLAQMMHDLRQGAPVAGVVVWSNSRFARNITHAQFYRAEIRKLGYTFHSISDKTVEGPEAVIFEALIDYKNQQYIDDMSIDVRRGLRQLVEQYGCVPGVPPVGFVREPVTISHHRDGKPCIAHRWVPDPEVAPRILQAFQMRAAGASLSAIAAETRLYTSVNSWRTFFPNRLYIGILQFGELTIEAYCDPLVPLDLFNAVQAIQGHYAGHHHVSADSPKHPRRANSAYLLSGLAHCARCGSPLFGRTAKLKSGARYTSYLCTRAYRTHDCTKHRLPAETLEAAVIAKVRETLLTPQFVHALYTKALANFEQQTQKNNVDRKVITAELGTVRKQLTHLTDAIAESGHTRSLLQRLNQLETDELTLLTRLTALDAQALPIPPPPSEQQLTAQLTQLTDLLTNGTHPQKQQLLRSLLHRIDVDRETNRIIGTLTVYYPINASPPTDDQLTSGGCIFMPTSQPPSGPPRYRHKINFTCKTRYKSRS